MTLHIAACLRIVAKYRQVPTIGTDVAAEAIRRVATKQLTTADRVLVEDLEHATGMRVAELAKLTEKWPKRT